jgi:hypothetical protein
MQGYKTEANLNAFTMMYVYKSFRDHGHQGYKTEANLYAFTIVYIYRSFRDYWHQGYNTEADHNLLQWCTYICVHRIADITLCSSFT